MGKLLRKWLIYGGIAASAVLVGSSIFAWSEYHQLQPSQHFAHVPTLTSNPGPNVANSSAKSGFQTQAQQQNGVASAPTATAKTFNILLIGSDLRSPNTPGHSDSMMIVHVNLIQHRYSILSLPRDSRVYFPGYGYTKLTSVQYITQTTKGIAPGLQASVTAVANLTGLTINYYMETDYWGLQDIVNAIGGIEMNVPYKVTLTHAWYPQDQGLVIQPGQHFFNGRMVTEVVHERYSLPNGDYDRQQLQENALLGTVKETLRPGNVTKIPALIKALLHYLIGTNFTMSDLLSLALEVHNLQTTDIQYYQISGKAIVAYDDILHANNDEIALDMQALHQIVKEHFTS